MNYIEQINMFWLLDAEHLFNGNESRLYFYLLKLSNSLYWKNPLTNADGYTAATVGISVNTLKTARNRLQQAGLIQFKPGGNGSRDKCIYTLVPAQQIINKVSEFDTLSANSLTPYPQPYPQNTDDISKHKPEETKQNLSSAAAAPPRPGRKKAGVKKKEGKDEPTEPHWQPIVEAWFAFNRSAFGDEPSFEKDDPKILKRILQRLKKRAGIKGIEWTEASALASFGAFLKSCYADEWLGAHYLLSNLENQFDKIVLNHGQRKENAAAAGHRRGDQRGVPLPQGINQSGFGNL